MQRSTDRILTTHTGSLPRPNDLLQVILAKEQGQPVDEAALQERIKLAVDEIVQKQVANGIDVVNDGEVSKIGYSTYVKDRLTGFEGEGRLAVGPADMIEFPELAQRLMGSAELQSFKTPACSGPIKYKDRAALQRDLDNLKAAVGRAKVADTFISAASPGVISVFLPNKYYPTHEAYIAALADAMREEYEAIVAAGFLVQVDCPDLAMAAHIVNAEGDMPDFKTMLPMHIAAINHALANVPSDRARLHLCWGNYEGPHHKDVPLSEVMPAVLQAKPDAISFVAANARHEHEYKLFDELKLPEGKILIPGVLDSTTNIIEHPELIAERLVRYGQRVGRENVIAGTDCGFATFAAFLTVDPGVTWAKFQSMAEGARLASEQLW